MEQTEERETAAASAGRTQHAIHVLSRDDAQAAALLGPSIDRIDSALPDLQVLVIAPDRDSVYAIAAAMNHNVGAPARSLLVPVTSSERSGRALANARAICATADDLVQLMGGARFKPGTLRCVAIAWAEAQVADHSRPGLEAVLAELPREADRLLLVESLTEPVEAFATAHLWKARRVQHPITNPTAAGALEYILCPSSGRTTILRLLLDRFDPHATVVRVYNEGGEQAARSALVALGLAGDGSNGVTLARSATDAPADLTILFDLPSDLGELIREAPANRTIALVPPDRVVAVQAAFGAGAERLSASTALRDAFTARDVLRDEIVGTLQGRPLTSEVLALEPLIESHDPVLLSAALVRLLENERARVRRSVAERTKGEQAPARREVVAAKPADSAWTRLFVNVGERDGVRRGDLVGAITGEAGIAGAQVGKIELRDTHALVEVAADIAGRVVERLNGVSLRGRRVVARVDGGRGPSERGSRPPMDRRGTPDRGPMRRDRGAARSETGGRAPRAMREADEWSSRGDRLRQSRPRGSRER